MFSKKPSAAEASESIYMRERVNKSVVKTSFEKLDTIGKFIFMATD